MYKIDTVYLQKSKKTWIVKFEKLRLGNFLGLYIILVKDF